MSNLTNFYNLYATLAQSAYLGRTRSYEEYLDSDLISMFDYSNTYKDNNNMIISGGKNLPNNGVLYLQKDQTIENFTVDIGGQTPVEYSRELLRNKEMGFSSYYLTDTKNLDHETKNVYLSIRGSDAFGPNSLNDWLDNNLIFTMKDSFIPQGFLAYNAIKTKLSELREKAPNAKFNVAAHSLGTIASVQGLSKLTVEELQQIGEVVLFNGPDTLKSLRKMGISEEKINILNEKVTYYVNPFDIVSMLNRNTDEQLGKVKVIVPFNFATTFDTPSSHDFGEFRIYSDGKVLEATEDFFPDYLYAGKKLSSLIDKYLTKIKNRGLFLTILGEISMYIQEGIDARSGKISKYSHIYPEFMKEYKAIINETKQAVIAWGNKNIPILQAAIQGATGAKKIELRSRLLLCISHLSRIESDEKVKLLKNELENYRQQVKEVVEKANHEAYHAGAYLGRNEVSQLVSQFQFSTVWDEGMFSYNVDELNRYIDKIYRFSDKLFTSVETLEDIDRKQSELFKVVSNSSFSLNSYKIERG